MAPAIALKTNPALMLKQSIRTKFFRPIEYKIIKDTYPITTHPKFIFIKKEKINPGIKNEVAAIIAMRFDSFPEAIGLIDFTEWKLSVS